MLEIYRRHIRHGIEEGVSDTETPQPDDLRDRRKNLSNRRFPHLVATRGGEVVGYAYVVLFRKRPAYRYTVKHSIYIHHAYIGQSIGQLLMRDRCLRCRRLPENHRLYRCRQHRFTWTPREVRIFQSGIIAWRRLSAWPLGRYNHGSALTCLRLHDSALNDEFFGTKTTRPGPRPSSRR